MALLGELVMGAIGVPLMMSGACKGVSGRRRGRSEKGVVVKRHDYADIIIVKV